MHPFIRITLLTSLISFVCAAPCCTITSKYKKDKAYPLAVPFELDDNHIFVQGQVNGSAAIWFALDSAAAFSLINIKRVPALSLQLQGGHQTQGAGGSIESSRVEGVKLNLPGVELTDQTIMALPLAGLQPSSGREFDVVLGYVLFERFVVEIDYATKLINLYDPYGYEYYGFGESIPVMLEGNVPYVRAKIVQIGREPIEGEFLIDTGSGRALILQEAFEREHKILQSVRETTQGRGDGVGGKVQFLVGRVNNLQLGSFILENPVTAFARKGKFAGDGKAGNIGNEILRRFKVIFDYARERMILEPNEHFAERFELSKHRLSDQ
jgi:hypothetical protein